MKDSNNKNRRQMRLLAALLFCWLAAYPGTISAATDTCSQGVGIPPFLSDGAAPNMLLLLDNSGSMLDMAYTDPDLDGFVDDDGDGIDDTADRSTQCFDESYLMDPNTGLTDISIEYAGNFSLVDADDQTQWYIWNNGSVEPWKTGTLYAQYDLVTFEGRTYMAQSAGTSAGETIEDDNGVDWQPVVRPQWRNNKWYHAYSFIFDDFDRVFYNETAGTSNGTMPGDDTGVTWTQVLRFEDDTVYAAETYVLGENMELFYTVDGGTSDGTKPTSDAAVEWIPVDFHAWRPGVTYAAADIVTYDSLIYVANAGHLSAGTTIYDDIANWTRIDEGHYVPATEADALAECSAAGGTAYYSNTDLCVTLNNGGAGTSDYVYAFAATGNFLNWATSSKFDIEKRILTGGKYNSEIERLISENRGCAGNRFIKQVPISQTSPSAADMYITMAVRMPDADDRVDWNDDTTRLEVYAITENGMDFAACQDAIEAFQDPGGLGPAEHDVEACVGFDASAGSGNNPIHIIYHKAIQECWFYAKHDRWKGGNDHPRMTCPRLYEDVSPLDINEWDPAYVCYGVFDETLPHDERTGFVGRCWEFGSGATGATCDPVPRDAALCDWINDDDPCEFQPGGANTDLFRHRSGSDYREICTQLKNNGTSCQNNNRWETYYLDSISGDPCNPTDDTYYGGTPTYWSDNLDGDDSVTTSPEPDLEDVADACVDQAMHDFCLQSEVPEVIDPSDEVTETSKYWNLPAILVDTGLAGQLGGRPLFTMKGHIQQTTQPDGILYEFAEDIRIGVMAFKDNGSKTECDNFAATCTRNAEGVFTVCATDPDSDLCDYCTMRQSIEKYCPATNSDGAEVIVPIDFGMVSTLAGEDWTHYEDVVTEINSTRATAWTPLAEAVFNAIGYYGQNIDLCLTTDDTGTLCEDFPINAADDPVEHWCQSNHILIITEGASTADINDIVADFVAQEVNGDPVYADSDATDQACTDGLEGSTFLDDLTWFAQEGELDAATGGIYVTPQLESEDKRHINTHIITTGSLGTADGDECTPATIMENAASNGDGLYLRGENPADLEDNLREILASILSRASAGSAASVISSSRSGSGAVYQAIFWPDLVDTDTQTSIQWVGDVHALFLDENGYLFEDTNSGQLYNDDGTSSELCTAVSENRLDPSEDLNNNGTLDDGEDLNNNGQLDGCDRRIIFYYSDTAARTRGCLNVTEFFANDLTCPDDPDPNNFDPSDPNAGECDASTDDCVELQDIDYLWSAANWLADASDVSIANNRSPYLSNADQRYIYTWNDLNNNGIVDSTEWLPFTAASLFPAGGLDVTPATGFPSRGTVADDFAFLSQADIEEMVGMLNGVAPTKEDAAKAVIDWVRGQDKLFDETLNGNTTDTDGNGRLDKPLRSRQFPFGAIEKTWRLGDVIHSTPTVVGRPAEAYHFIYKDPTYAQFAKRWADRRQMVYYGANDGMLHATNGGFFHEATESFCRELNSSYDHTDPSSEPCVTPTTMPELGAEMWAYIPYNLIPHLKCLTDPDYEHKYYVDHRPRIFDVQIFQDDCDYTSGVADCTNAVHPGGWGTILVGSMRFGGAPVEAAEIGSSEATDNRKFVSAFFILDITNPEEPPELLGEMTMTTESDAIPSYNGSPVINTTLYADLGYTTSSPTMVVMREDTGATNWYLIMGSGPNTLKGENEDTDDDDYNRRGKIAILPLEWLKGEVTTWSAEVGSLYSPKTINSASRKAFRIPNRQPGGSGHQSGTEGGSYWLPDDTNSFVSDLITVDYDVETAGVTGLGGLYRSDAVYFGTVDGETFIDPEGDTEWYGDGRLYRLVTKYLVSGSETASEPNQWNDAESGGVQYNDGTITSGWWSPYRLLIDAQGPVTAAPSVGWDGKTFWVYFGTGRFYDRKDKPDNNQGEFFNYFGIREPFDISGDLDCYDLRLSWETISWDIETDTLGNLNHNGVQGVRGLIRSDDIIVSEFASSRFDIPYLKCAHCVEEDISVDGDGYYCQSYDDLGLGEDGCFPADLPYISATDTSVDQPETDTTTYRFEDLRKYIAGTSCDTGLDGWYREFHEERERNIGQAALLGGLLTYTGYQPYDDICQAEGVSFLYGVHFQTGTAWYENVFGTFDSGGNRFVKDKLSLGRGLATKASMHVGSGKNDATAFVQTSTGEIIEIGQENLPLSNTKSGRTGWSDDTD